MMCIVESGLSCFIYGLLFDLVLGRGARAVPLSGHVGFDSMPDQLVNKSVNHGFCFNILCVGECVMSELLFPWGETNHLLQCMSHPFVNAY